MIFDSSLLIAAMASFVAGVLGYIIARLWIRPIVRYNITKRRLGQELNQYQAGSENASSSGEKGRPNSNSETLRRARKHAMDLTACYRHDIPYWYRLLLDSRGESPSEASGQLTNLSKIRERGTVIHRLTTVRRSLHLK